LIGNIETAGRYYDAEDKEGVTRKPEPVGSNESKTITQLMSWQAGLKTAAAKD
jgi:hypothetical protein